MNQPRAYGVRLITNARPRSGRRAAQSAPLLAALILYHGTSSAQTHAACREMLTPIPRAQGLSPKVNTYFCAGLYRCTFILSHRHLHKQRYESSFAPSTLMLYSFNTRGQSNRPLFNLKHNNNFHGEMKVASLFTLNGVLRIVYSICSCKQNAIICYL